MFVDRDGIDLPSSSGLELEGQTRDAMAAPLKQAATVAPKNLPPLFAAFYHALREGCSGTVTVALGEERAVITISSGRVISVSHPNSSGEAVVEAMKRFGLLNEKMLQKAERIARRKAMLLEEATVVAGYVSAGTLANIREKLCQEVLLDLLLRRDCDVSAVWTLRKGSREMCVLPLPYLLKEAQRRARELPDVMRVLGSWDVVFARTAAHDSGQRWEDLKLSAAEKQVYFFVDGKRTVRDIALAACQSEFEVARALKSLVEADLVRRVDRRTETSRPPRTSNFLRVIALCVVLAILVLIVVVSGGRVGQMWAGPAAPDPFASVVGSAPGRRIAAGMRMYYLVHGRAPATFQQLLEEGWVVPRDARAAVLSPDAASSGEMRAPGVNGELDDQER